MHRYLSRGHERSQIGSRENLRGVKKKLEQDSPKDYVVDGTERPIQRPKDNEEQEKFYSGKSHQHAVKSGIVINLEKRRVDYLSKTVESSKHDKTLLDEAALEFPKGSTLLGDLGFQGYEAQETLSDTPEYRTDVWLNDRFDQIEHLSFRKWTPAGILSVG